MKRKLFALLSLLVLASMILTACGGAAATEAPAAEPTEPPATEMPATEAPATEAPMSDFVGDKVEAESCDYGGEFQSIEAVDQYTVKFSLCYPDGAFLNKVAFAAFQILDKDYLNEMGGDTAKISEAPNGTGPYTLGEWVRGDHITFEANPNYWGEAPTIQTLIFRWSTEAAQRLLELQSGTVDAVFAPAAEDFEAIEADPNLVLIPYDSPNVMYLGMNNTIPPFDNPQVRQAISMAINKQQIVDLFYPPGSTIAEQFVPPSISPGFSTTGDGASWYEYDPEGAKALLAEAGFPDGFETTFSFRDVTRIYVARQPQVAQEIQAQLAEIGVTINITPMESGTFLESVAAGEQPFFLLGWGLDYPDATNFYDFHFAGGVPRFGDQWPDIVEQIRAAAQAPEASVRQEHYDQVAALIKEHTPMIPVAHGAAADVFSASVGNVKIGALNENFQEMTTDDGQLVWIQGGEPISLWCGDETDGETFRACLQIYDSLLAYEFGGTQAVPALAESWESNEDGTEWTFTLRQGVTFHNGATFDANDVVATYSALWDASNPNHVGNSGAFEYTVGFFGALLNAPQ
ncbi:MAG TPA: ABC transporter substrate-binding protein [Anaerolineales bacterium]|nr:ABC transporter substrate-binding protein [Anaerolineales bacterium]